MDGPLYAAGKSATLVVEGSYEKHLHFQAYVCYQHSTCATCISNGCAWSPMVRLCVEYGWWVDSRTWLSGECAENITTGPYISCYMYVMSAICYASALYFLAIACILMLIGYVVNT